MIPYESVLDLIGNTPLVDVSRLSPNPNVRIIAKLENQYASYSIRNGMYYVFAPQDGQAISRLFRAVELFMLLGTPFRSWPPCVPRR